MDGIPAMMYGMSRWKCYILLRTHPTSTHQAVRNHCRGEIRRKNPITKLKRSGKRDVDELSNADHVVTNASSSRSSVVHFWIIKGRSFTMRHVSRTHRVAWGHAAPQSQFDPKYQIEFVDTKNQLDDMLTKGSFTRDEWNHLLRLFSIIKFSMFSCSYFLSINKPNTMSRTVQERRTGEGSVVAKSKSVSLISRHLNAKQSPTLDWWITDGAGILIWRGLRGRCGIESKTQ